jgi:hypothetical protein
MSLRDRLEDIKNDTAQLVLDDMQAGFTANKGYQELKSSIHRKLC